MAKETVISVKHVSKDFRLPHQKVGSIKNGFTNMFSMGNRSFEVQHALKDIDFTVQKGEFFGIVGRNGSGKSTLLKILAGIYQPTKGSVKVEGRVIPFIELGVGFNGDLSGRENVYLNGALLGFSESEINAKYQDIVGFAELERFMDQKLKNYSSGMQVRLAFSVATRLAESDVLLIDEVLAVGDADFQRKCFRYFKQLKKQEKTVVFVTHDMNAVREYCDRAVLINQNKVVEIGSPQKISKLYEQLLMPEKSGAEMDASTKRWGDRSLEITSVSLDEKNQDEISMKVVVKAHKKCDDPVFGFLVRNGSGVSILGTNTMLNRTKMRTLKVGHSTTIEVSFPNIFADGEYGITLAMQYENGLTNADWWEDAKNFTVAKSDHSPYLVDPGMRILISKENIT